MPLPRLTMAAEFAGHRLRSQSSWEGPANSNTPLSGRTLQSRNAETADPIQEGRSDNCVLVAAAQQRLRGLLDVQPSHAGLHLIGWLAQYIDARRVSRASFHQGVDVLPLSAYALTPQARSSLVLVYACANP